MFVHPGFRIQHQQLKKSPNPGFRIRNSGLPYITLIKHLYSTFKFVNPAKNFRVVRLHNVLGRNKGEDVEEIQQHFPVVAADAEEFHAELLHLAAERLFVVEPTATRLKQ